MLQGRLGIRALRLLTLDDLLDLPPQHFALRDGDLLLTGLARDRSTQELPSPLPSHDDELEPVVLRCSFHVYRLAFP